MTDDLVDDVLDMPVFDAKPPVLFDLGASDGRYPKWEKIAEHAVCVAFDADDRDIDHFEDDSTFRRLYAYNKVAHDRDDGDVEFHLTESPHYSSTLPPDPEEVEQWGHAGSFDVAETETLPSISVSAIVDDLDLDRVDWFKANTQGTDLRLFDALPAALRDRVLVAEFEPGLMDAYAGEDKLGETLAYMDDRPFWTADMSVNRGQRVAPELVQRRVGRAAGALVDPLSQLAGREPTSAHVTFFNEGADGLGRRELLLEWVFATVEGHDGFALALAERGLAEHGDDAFETLSAHSGRRLRRTYLRSAPALASAALASPARALAALRERAPW